MSRKSRRNRKIAGKALIAAGSFLIVFVIAINVIDLVKSRFAINEFKQAQAQIVVAKIDDSDNKNDNVTSGNDAAMCLLRIPKINLEEAVKEGSTRGVLSSALGHVENTAMPGEDGNCCIAGHRNYAFGKYFNRLDEITSGDVIELETRDNLYQYEVVGVEVVEPEDVSVLDYKEGNNLTLITCTPILIGSHRLIVHAIMK